MLSDDADADTAAEGLVKKDTQEATLQHETTLPQGTEACLVVGLHRESKNTLVNSCPCLCQMLTDFQNSFIRRLDRQFAAEWSSTITKRVRRTATWTTTCTASPQEVEIMEFEPKGAGF